MRKGMGLLLVAPAMLLIFALLIWPLFYTVYCSAFKLDYLQFSGFVGFKNYAAVLGNPDLYASFGITLVITVCSMGISLVLGLGLALWINKRKGLVALGIQLAGLLPWVISMMVGAMLWRWILNGDTSLFNHLLRMMGAEPVLLFNRKTEAVVTLIAVMAWRTIGYAMVMILAGLKGVPDTLVEAGEVDGANRWHVLTNIRLPLIKTPLLICTIVLTMSNFNNNTVPLVLTNGGPSSATTVITLYLYKLSFSYYKFGIASALSTLLFVINTVMIILYIRMVKYEI
jgi:ABC-type sugar transport system permease subunit